MSVAWGGWLLEYAVGRVLDANAGIAAERGARQYILGHTLSFGFWRGATLGALEEAGNRAQPDGPALLA